MENKVAILSIASFLTSDKFDDLAIELASQTVCEVTIKTDCGCFMLEVAGIDIESFE